MQEQYRTVARAGVHETEINRSRFICALAPAATEQEAQDFVARVRKEHPTASHNCFAYVIGADAAVQKASGRRRTGRHGRLSPCSRCSCAATSGTPPPSSPAITAA